MEIASKDTIRKDKKRNSAQKVKCASDVLCYIIPGILISGGIYIIVKVANKMLMYSRLFLRVLCCVWCVVCALLVYIQYINMPAATAAQQ